MRHLLGSKFVGFAAILALAASFSVSGEELPFPKHMQGCAGLLAKGKLTGDEYFEVLAAAFPGEFKGIQWNLKNLFLAASKFLGMSGTEIVPERHGHPKDTGPKNEKMTALLGQIIEEQNPTMITGQEIDNLGTMIQFDDRYLHNKFEQHLIDGNDKRLIDVGNWFRQEDLERSGLEFEIRTNKGRTWNDPFAKKTVPIFARDFPVWILRHKATGTPLMIISGAHLKSKREAKERPGDFESNAWRTREVEEIVTILGELEKEFGTDIPMLLTGDFNTEVSNAPELAPLRKKMFEAFAYSNITEMMRRFSHVFFHGKGPGEKSQVDAVFMNAAMARAFEAIYRAPYIIDGHPVVVPLSWEERERAASDHLPLIYTLNFLKAKSRAAPVMGETRH